MFNSLRSRLLLSYGILILILVVLFSAGSFTALLKNPLIYESAAEKLRTAQQDIRPKYSLAGNIDPNQAVDQIAKKYEVRALISSNDGDIAADSGMNDSPTLKLQTLRLERLALKNEVGFLRDRNNQLWLGLIDRIDQDTVLILAVRRPRLGVVVFFTSELLRPFMISAIIGLLAAILFGWMMARWISNPVRRIEQATHSFAAGMRQTIPLDGPTEIKQLAESFNHMSDQVQLAQQAQRDLVANVSHELKTPLTSIQGFSQAILDGVIQSPSDQERTLKLIHAEANRMGRLVQDLVALPRLEAGVEFHFEPMDLRPLLQHLSEKYKLPASQGGLDLRMQVENLSTVRADADRLAQVISNLLDNAIKYTPTGGHILLAAGVTGKMVEIRVADDGPGIPPQDAGKVFDRFYRAEGTRSQAGSGLGLAISKQIINAHSGQISLQPALPHGCIFSIYLPIS
jgi:signal transduction histidine kinase